LPQAVSFSRLWRSEDRVWTRPPKRWAILVRSASRKTKTLLRQSQDKKTIEYWRLFIAIELPAEIRHTINEHITRLREACPDVRASWTREENLHLTLKFFGDVAVNRVDTLSQALMRAVTRTTEFDLVIEGCGVFPPRGKPNVLWIGISPETAPACLGLYQAIEDECAKVGFKRDERKFHPHLTVARLRHPAGARDLANLHQATQFEPVASKVTSVCLIRSELSSSGSRYTIIARHDLNNA
jgi:2'-5' RNA ligase